MSDKEYHWRKSDQDGKTQVLMAPDGQRLATVKIRSWWWSTTIDVSLSDGRTFTMSRPSIWNSKVSIMDAQGNQVGTYATSTWWTWEGALTWQGKTYEWKNRNWWSSKCAWSNEQGNDYFLFTTKWSWTAAVQADVEQLRPSPDDVVLLVIGWYLLYLGMMDSATATSSV